MLFLYQGRAIVQRVMRNIDKIVKVSGRSLRTVQRFIAEIGIKDIDGQTSDIINLICTYLLIDGANKKTLRDTIKRQIESLLDNVEEKFDSDFKKYLLKESDLKNELLRNLSRTLESKDEAISRMGDSLGRLSLDLVRLLDDISMLRIEDKGTVQRLYDKNVLADLLTDLSVDSEAYLAVRALLDRLNDKRG